MTEKPVLTVVYFDQPTHLQACVCWSKYTTFNTEINDFNQRTACGVTVRWWKYTNYRAPAWKCKLLPGSNNQLPSPTGIIVTSSPCPKANINKYKKIGLGFSPFDLVSP